RCCQSQSTQLTQLLLLLLLSLAEPLGKSRSRIDLRPFPVIDDDDTPASAGWADNLDPTCSTSAAAAAWSLLKGRDALCRRPTAPTAADASDQTGSLLLATPSARANCLCHRPDRLPTGRARTQDCKSSSSAAGRQRQRGPTLLQQLGDSSVAEGANGGEIPAGQRGSWRAICRSVLAKEGDGRFKRKSPWSPNRVLDREEKDRWKADVGSNDEHTGTLLAVELRSKQLTGTLNTPDVWHRRQRRTPNSRQEGFTQSPLREDSPVGHRGATVLVRTDKDSGRMGRGLLRLTGAGYAACSASTKRDCDDRGAVVHARDGDSGPGGEVDCKLSDTAGGADGLLVGGFVLSASQRDRMYTPEVYSISFWTGSSGHVGAGSGLHRPADTAARTIRLRIVDQNDNARGFWCLPRRRIPISPCRRMSPGSSEDLSDSSQPRTPDEEPNNKAGVLPVADVSSFRIDGAFQIDASTGEMFAVRPVRSRGPEAGGARAPDWRSVAAAAPAPRHNVGVGLGPDPHRHGHSRAPEYKFRVAEEAKDYRKVGTVAADDADESDASAIEYRIDHDVDHEFDAYSAWTRPPGTKTAAGQARQGDQEHLRISGAGVRRRPSPQAAVGATAGYSLLEAKAIDSDLHDNGRVSYSLIDATNSGLQIDSSSGTLFNSSSLGSNSGLQRISCRIWGTRRCLRRGSGGRNAGKDSYSASHRMRATVVIGLIVFFFLLLVLAAAAALVLLRPCRRADARCSSKAASPTVEEVAAILSAASTGGVGEKVDDGEEAGRLA
uniref:Cadherin domain-containing protein n=1 Tax=Macrostomum lignano TaxID=282301 RepID=A0A1I8FQR7_9PLAT